MAVRNKKQAQLDDMGSVGADVAGDAMCPALKFGSKKLSPLGALGDGDESNDDDEDDLYN